MASGDGLRIGLHQLLRSTLVVIEGVGLRHPWLGFRASQGWWCHRTLMTCALRRCQTWLSRSGKRTINEALCDIVVHNIGTVNQLVELPVRLRIQSLALGCG